MEIPGRGVEGGGLPHRRHVCVDGMSLCGRVQLLAKLSSVNAHIRTEIQERVIEASCGSLASLARARRPNVGITGVSVNDGIVVVVVVDGSRVGQVQWGRCEQGPQG
jgi:hypothetical protein